MTEVIAGAGIVLASNAIMEGLRESAIPSHKK
jgi:hypothetical protein